MDVKVEAAKLMGGGFGGPVSVTSGEGAEAHAEAEAKKKPEVESADGEPA